MKRVKEAREILEGIEGMIDGERRMRGVVKFGEEDANSISEEEYRKIMTRGTNCIIEMVEVMHFNKGKPENHNVYIGRKNSQRAKIYKGDGEWEEEEIEKVIDRMIDDSDRMLMEKREGIRGIPIMFKYYVRARGDEKMRKHHKEDIRKMMYEKRGIVKN